MSRAASRVNEKFVVCSILWMGTRPRVMLVQATVSREPRRPRSATEFGKRASETDQISINYKMMVKIAGRQDRFAGRVASVYYVCGNYPNR